MIRTRTSPRLVNWTYHIPSYTWLFPREPRTLYSHIELYYIPSYTWLFPRTLYSHIELYYIPSYTWLFPREPRTLYSHIELYYIPSYTWLFPREPRTLYSHIELYLHTCNAKWAIFQLYHCENKLRLMEMMMSAISLREQEVSSDGDDDDICFVLDEQVNMSLHSDTLFRLKLAAVFSCSLMMHV
jgi:hypothetical protein